MFDAEASVKCAKWLVGAGLGLVLAGCGAAREPGTGSSAARIVGGSVDDTDKAAVGLAVNVLGYFSGHCSGSLIAPNLVLTARHCVSLTQGGGPAGSVICGQTNFGFTGSGDLFRATTLTVRPDQDGPDFYKGIGTVVVPANATDICGNDVALITLEGAGIPASEATPIIPRIDSKPEVADPYSAIGYGYSDPAKTPESYGTRRRLDGKLVSCVGTYCPILDSVQDSEWMGQDGTCNGDSGGPALDAQGRVMGVLSRGADPCASSVYSDVSSHKDLIMQTALTAAQAGGYSPPFWALSGSSTPPPEPDGGAAGAGNPDAQDQPCSLQTLCPTGYECMGNGDTGQCAAKCDPAASACGAGLTCDTDYHVCLAPPAKQSASGDSGGCAMRGPVKPHPWLVGVALGALALLRRRRVRYSDA